MSFRSSKHSHAWFHLRSWPNARISKGLLPILPTASQLLYQPLRATQAMFRANNSALENKLLPCQRTP